MRGGGKLGKPTHLRRNLRRMMGRSATFFFARYEGVPRGHLNQHYERTDQVFSALPSRPTGDMSVDFLDMSAKGRAGCNAALSSLSLVLACSAMDVPLSLCVDVCWKLRSFYSPLLERISVLQNALD